MKYKVLGVSTEREVNIGDYVQGLASSQFLPSIDGFIQREKLKQFDDNEVSKMIMNGWYMHHPENWPPSDKITPLFVAFHMNSLAKKQLLSVSSLKYLKQHEPIGCRDMKTRDTLIENGVKAYFSGCMTLTLGYRYKNLQTDNKVYFVDPYFVTEWNLLSIFKNALELIINWKDIDVISAKYPDFKTGLRKKMILTTFYREYRKIFTRETLINAEYINQQSVEIKGFHQSEEDFLKEAERLVRKYALAKLVVTSRIHTALPCLAVETPVIYIEDTNQSEASACRLDGLREFFTIINWNKNKLEKQSKIIGLISLNNYPENKETWRPIAQELIKSCKLFVSNN